MVELDWRNPNVSAILAERADRLKRLREDPAMLGGLKAYYRDRPWQFVDDWGMTVDPRNIERGLPATLPFRLFPRQREWMEWTLDKWRTQRPGITEKSRDCGISWCAVTFVCTMCLLHDGFMAGFGSRKEEYVDKAGHPKSLFYKGRMFVSNLPVEFRGSWDAKKHAPHMRIEFPDTGSVITGEAGDNIGRGDRAAIYVIDESAYLEHPDLIDASLSATTNCRQDVSSVNGLANSFAARRHSGKISVFVFDWRDDPRKDQAWYDKQVNDLPPIVVAQEIDRNYTASAEGVIIPGEWVQAAVDAHKRLGIQPTGSRFGALDVADTGTDKNCLAVRHGVLLSYLSSWSGKGTDIFATTARAMAECDAAACTEWDFDGDGLGAGVRGDARKLNEDRSETILSTVRPLRSALPQPQTVGQFRGSESVLFPTQRVRGPDGKPLDRTNEDFFANRKAQAWWALRFRFEQTSRALAGLDYDPADIISIDSNLPELTGLISELSQPVYKLDGAGRILVDKKPDGVASPNRGDACMICYAPRRQPMRIAQSLLGG